MTDETKLLSKIRQGKKNVRPADLRKLMRQFGFVFRETKHQILYKHSKFHEIKASVVEHKEGGQENKVYECYVKNCLNAIDELLSRGVNNEKRTK